MRLVEACGDLDGTDGSGVASEGPAVAEADEVHRLTVVEGPGTTPVWAKTGQLESDARPVLSGVC